MKVGRLRWIGRTLQRALCGSVILAVAACSEPTESTLPAALNIPPAAEVHAQQGPSPTWTKIVLGPLPGSTFSVARDISDNGVVVGESTSPGQLPFYWSQAGGMKQLAVPIHAIKGVAQAISDNGAYATGHVELGDGRKVPVRWRWSLGVSIVTLIGCHSDPGFDGTGHGVNNAGTVVGSTNGAAWSWALGTSCSSPVVVQGITMTSALDINDLGTIVGLGWSPYRGFIKTSSYSAQLQPRPGHYSSSADAVDDANLVAGRSLIVNGVDSTVYWTGTQGPPALVLGPNNNLSRVSVSDKGRYVWSVTTNGLYAGMSRKGTTTWALSIWPNGVNACGDIVGSENGLAVLMKKVVCD